jgi:photosystem II stability/assembly factor-like uncharacterized protein
MSKFYIEDYIDLFCNNNLKEGIMKVFSFFLCFLFYLYTPQFLQAQSDWFSQISGTTSDLYSLSFANSNTGWAAGSDKILKTTNGGDNWTGLPHGISDLLKSVYFIDLNTGWVCGNNGLIGKTTNGGINWTVQLTPIILNLYSIYFIDNNTGWAAGGKAVLKTTNGGDNWISVSQLAGDLLSDVYFIDHNTGWVIGYTSSGMVSLIRMTLNGGLSWYVFAFPTPPSVHMISLSFGNAYTGCAVGNEGKIMLTANGGVNWQQVASGNTEFLNSVYFTGLDSGWIVGSNSTILKTTDGGHNWYNQSCGVSSNFNCVRFVDNNTGWAVGSDGYIIKTTNGGGPIGIQPISNNVPDKLYLYQNYPNPFNPSTSIEFDIPKSSFVKLAVYDVLGKEAAILVNEELKAGRYKTEWKATGYPSGLYFYKLITGEYTETRIMVLVK